MAVLNESLNSVSAKLTTVRVGAILVIMMR